MKKNKITLGLVACRGGSKGIPRKNLLKINGKELITIAAEAALSTPEIDQVICSTDSEELADTAKQANLRVPFIRPKELALDDTPMLPVLEHALKWIEKNDQVTVERVVIVDPTAPLRTSEDISKVINLFSSKEADLALSVHLSHQNPYFNMLEKGENDFFKLPLGDEENYGSRQSAPIVYSINTLCWVYSRNAIVNEKKRIPKKTIIYEFPENLSIDIDTYEDLSRLEYQINKKDN